MDHLQLADKLSNAPASPGCYIYKDEKGNIIYIGKAIILNNRVKQYFGSFDPITPSSRIEPKKQIMVGLIRDVEYIVTDSEIEALILETNLIKKYKPKYNTLMVDDKNYGWIMITDYEDFPRIFYVREKKDKRATYFGPFPSTFPAKQTVKRLRRLFPYRTCNRRMEEVVQKDGSLRVVASDPKPCLYYHIELCKAPCASFQLKKDYRKNINSIKKYLRGDKKDIEQGLEKIMANFAKEQEFERAAEVRDRLFQLKYITQRIGIDEGVDEEKWREYRKQRAENSLSNLKERLVEKGIISKEHLLRRIECFDISNIQGKLAVGSMVTFIDGKKSKHNYRKFKIRTKDTPDDYTMMKEMLSRRFKYVNEKNSISFKEDPDLVIIDGGRGQLSIGLQVREELEINIPFVSLAKKEERIVYREGDEFKDFKLNDKEEATFLVQRIRDEAHRFGITYHRNLRSKNQLTSKLDKIPGVGEATKKKLMDRFKSVKNIERATREELLEVIKNEKIVANIIKFI